MTLSKREFVQVLSAASVAGMSLSRFDDADAAEAQQGLYEIAPFGNVSFLHMTDFHAQLKPSYFREPSVNIGVGAMQGQLPHLVGEHLLKLTGTRPATDLAYAFTSLDFDAAARRYRRVGVGLAEEGGCGPGNGLKRILRPCLPTAHPTAPSALPPPSLAGQSTGHCYSPDQSSPA